MQPVSRVTTAAAAMNVDAAERRRMDVVVERMEDLAVRVRK
jgi:hypothetical protein